jgi:hypothetical protein
VPHELSEYSLTDIHPLLSAIATQGRRVGGIGKIQPRKTSNRQIGNCFDPADSGRVIRWKKYLAGQLWNTLTLTGKSEAKGRNGYYKLASIDL